MNMQAVTRRLQMVPALCSSTRGRRHLWPAAAPLETRHLENCKVLASREKMLELLPKGSVCAELGIFRCEFSEKILSLTEPRKLHLIDISPRSVELAKQKFRWDAEVETHLGDSAETLLGLPEEFDWIYIDGDHSYSGAKRDLEAARRKLKAGGLICCNDYIFFGTSDLVKYGVVEAVNEFCLQSNFELVYFALQGRMYCDVVLRERAA
jgi:SAM-dependent methyltransferase